MELAMDNPLTLNDWHFPKFWRCVILLQIALVGLIVMEEISSNLHSARTIIAGIYVLFIPGTVMMRILRIHDQGGPKSAFLAVTLSLAFLMAMGLFLNMFLPALGIERALDPIPLIIGYVTLTWGMLYLAWLRDRHHAPSGERWALRVSFLEMFLIGLPFGAVLSTAILNRTFDNVYQWMVIAIVAVTIVYLGISRKVPEKYYPMAIFSLSLTLLLHSSLVSNFIVEWADVSIEFGLGNRILSTGYWDSGLLDNTNAMLMVMIAPFASSMTGLEMTWIFKIVFPIFLSLIPAVLCTIFQRMMPAKIALLSSMVIISAGVYSTTFLGLNRQIVAEMFMVAVLLIMMDGGIAQRARLPLLIAMGVMMCLSHYGTSVIFVLIFGLTLILISVAEILERYPIKRWRARTPPNEGNIRKWPTTVTEMWAFYIFTIAIALSWYAVVAQSTILDSIIDFIGRIFSSIGGGLPSPSGAPGLASTAPWWERWNNALLSMIYILIAVGLILSLVRRSALRLSREYVCLSLSAALLLVAGYQIPVITGFVSLTRLTHIVFLIIVPFFPLGVHLAVNLASRLRNYHMTEIELRRAASALFTLILVMFFILGSGLVNSVSNEPIIYSLDPDKVARVNFNEQEYRTGKWVTEHIGFGPYVHGDNHGSYLMMMASGRFDPIRESESFTMPFRSGSYIYLSSDNLRGLAWLDDPNNLRLNVSLVPIKTAKFYPEVLSSSLVYSSGYTQIYLHP